MRSGIESSPARPPMDNDRWNHVDQLLQSAIDIPAVERDAYLRNACGGDQRLEDEVRSLLAAHDRADRFLGAPAIDLAARELVRPQRQHEVDPGDEHRHQRGPRPHPEPAGTRADRARPRPGDLHTRNLPDRTPGPTPFT